MIAEPGAGQGMTQAARDALRRVDSVLAENSGPLKDTIANFKVFSEGLARNTGKLDGIVAGLERMTGVTSPPPKITYDLRALQNSGPAGKAINVQWAIPEPTAVAMLETQRFLFSPAQDYPGFAEAMWADALPKLMQARLIESFENYDIAHAPLRMADIGQAEFQLLIDVRRFRIAVESEPAAEIGLSARIVDKNGKVVASRLFEESEKFASRRPGCSRRRVQRSVRPDCEGHDRMDGAGVPSKLGECRKKRDRQKVGKGSIRRQPPGSI